MKPSLFWNVYNGGGCFAINKNQVLVDYEEIDAKSYYFYFTLGKTEKGYKLFVFRIKYYDEFLKYNTGDVLEYYWPKLLLE